MKRFSLYEFSLWGQDFVSVVRIIEVIFTKNVWAFSRDQVNCPYQRGVRKERFDCKRFGWVQVNRLKETKMGVAQVFDRLYDGVSFLMGTSFRAKKYWLSVLFLSRLISYCWLFPWPARQVSIQRSHVKSRESSTRVRGAGKEGEPPPFPAAPLARAF